MTTYYAIVDGDPISSGGNVHVLERDEWIEGPDGRERAVAYLGDQAYCEACKTWGVLVPHAGIARYLRTDHHKRGAQAVSGDGVICKCEPMPVVMAVYGRSESMDDIGDSARLLKAQTPSRDIYDERFTLTDREGNPLRNVRYRVRTGSNVLASGVTDSGGRTQRIVTNGSQALRLEVEH
ncbi:PAAR domain-containing protein [Paraburkholderia sp. CNPSo 3272]|uniref:PAAR domain-containing protein n=1 Tax=Paraburkholderia sp. CNPSo 3272 TaxID=2940931 RepID=UPI0020B8116A|nr:PAAR domain-containing protein [Paraburkholderia sp. CNPSo 3272]MCP3722761.1 PAAR domain-containing protein [Paraburkholderia sp. CNPSo 3272]